ncbi:MAG: amidohydrolase family protein [Bacillota bacterium]
MDCAGFKIVDFHSHLPVGSWPANLHPTLRKYSRERSLAMAREWCFPEAEPFAETPDEIQSTVRRWAQQVIDNDLECVVFVTGGGNDTLADAVRQYPRYFRGFAHHHICSPGALDELRRAVEELGLCGFKMHGPRLHIPFEDPSLDPIWQYIERAGIPVLIHFGLLRKAGGVVYHPRMSPLTLAPVAHKYPDIPFVIPHFGCGYPQELLHLCWSCPNIYVDTSGSNQWMRWMPYPLTLEDLFRKFYETIGPDRIIFGTDSSWFPRGFTRRYLEDQLRACRWLGIREDDIKKIFRDNALRLLQRTKS